MEFCGVGFGQAKPRSYRGSPSFGGAVHPETTAPRLLRLMGLPGKQDSSSLGRYLSKCRRYDVGRLSGRTK